jgi:hypothetical protein
MPVMRTRQSRQLLAFLPSTGEHPRTPKTISGLVTRLSRLRRSRR